MLYRGSSLLTLDSKGRIAMPSRFRESLQEECSGRVIATTYFNYSLAIYPLPVWDELEKHLQGLNSSDPLQRGVREMFLGHADERELDAQGRILLAPALREYARLERDAKLLGDGDKFLVRSQAMDAQWLEQVNERLNDPQHTKALKKFRL